MATQHTTATGTLSLVLAPTTTTARIPSMEAPDWDGLIDAIQSHPRGTLDARGTIYRVKGGQRTKLGTVRISFEGQAAIYLEAKDD